MLGHKQNCFNSFYFWTVFQINKFVISGFFAQILTLPAFNLFFGRVTLFRRRHFISFHFISFRFIFLFVKFIPFNPLCISQSFDGHCEIWGPLWNLGTKPKIFNWLTRSSETIKITKTDLFREKVCSNGWKEEKNN